jgi:hypothetical protein
MIYHRIVDLIKHQPERLAESWCEHIRESASTSTYHRLSVEELAERHIRLFENLARWLEQTMGRDELRRFFVELGRERCLEGFPLWEVNYALLLAKRDFRDLISAQGLLDSSLEFYQAFELISSMDQFFDLGNFHIIRGYMRELRSTLEESGLQAGMGPGSATPKSALTVIFGPFRGEEAETKDSWEILGARRPPRA